MHVRERSGVLLILLSAVGYSLFPIFTKGLFAEGLRPLDVGFWRFFLAMALYWAILAARRRTDAAPVPRLKLLASGVFIAAAALTGFFGLELIPASIYVMLFYSYPAIVALFSLLLGERLSARAWVALALTLVGVILTIPDLSAGLGGGNLLGVVFALVNALVVACYFIVSSRLLRGSGDALMGSALTITGAFVIVSLIAVPRGVGAPVDFNGWLLVALLVTCSTVIPYLALNAGIQRLGAARSAIISTVEPVLALGLSFFLLGERILTNQLLGGVLILAGVILLQLPGRARTAAAPVETGTPAQVGD